MVANLHFIFPAHPVFMGAFLGICIAYLIYSAAKFIISIYTGA